MNKVNGIILNPHFINKMDINGQIGWFSVESNPSTGYYWGCTTDNSGIYEIIEEITLTSSVDADGVHGMVMWKVKAINEGHGEIMFELFSPTGIEPVQMITLNIEVTK